MSTLVLRNLTKRYKDLAAIQDLTLDIRAGEFFSIVGPSGCGKTTLLRIIAGFEQPTQGRVVLGGEDITQVPPQQRNIGMVFQNYALFPHMTVFQNVAFGLETKKLPKSRVRPSVERILESVRLTEKVDELVPNLSGGEQQRVAVARALVVEPKVLLMDEPLSNLDVTLRTTTREEIRALQRAVRITTVYVTHDQAEAMSISDRIAVMRAGKIEQVGTPFEIYEAPTSIFVSQFVGGANLLKGEVRPSDGHFLVGDEAIPVPTVISASGMGAVTIALKPEAITLVPDPGPQAFAAVVADKEYHGFTTTLVVRTFGISLRVSTGSSDLTRKVVPGDTVGISIDWSKSTVFRGE